jgi:DNA ligase (NAD+)
VGRAGDVIPDIIKVFPELRSGKEKDFKMPKVCPVCKSDLFKPQGQIMWYCPNKSCFAQLRRSFYHFVSKPAFNIVGLGPKIIDRLIDEGLVSTPPDLFNLKEGDISHLERFAEKSAKNLINSIQSRKEIALPNLIYALGIRNVGEKTALDLVNHFGSLEKIMNASIEELSSVKDIGPVVAESIYKWFRDKKNLEILKKIKEVGIKIITINSSDNLKLKGKNFVFTGTLSSMSRQEAKKRVIEQGGEVSESVSKKTDYVVVGENPGSKLKKALDLGVKIIKEEDFLKMI